MFAIIILNYSKWNKPSSSSDSQLLPSPTPASRPDSLNKLHAHAPSPLDKPVLVSLPSTKPPTTDSAKVLTLPLAHLSALSPTPKLLNRVHLNAAHATLDPTLLPQADQRPDTTTSPEASQLLSQSNGLNQETQALHQLERPTNNQPPKSATPATAAQVPPTVAALQSAPTEPPPSEQLLHELVKTKLYFHNTLRKLLPLFLISRS